MSHRLSFGPNAVMTAGAGTGQNRGVTENYRCERTDVVAGVATAGDLDVSKRHGSRTALIIDNVATNALARRRLENPLDMARLATHTLMRPHQGKSRR